jgi:hypothetical protein
VGKKKVISFAPALKNRLLSKQKVLKKIEINLVGKKKVISFAPAFEDKSSKKKSFKKDWKKFAELKFIFNFAVLFEINKKYSSLKILKG